MTITASKPKMNSYLPYFGGKRTLASAIVAELGKHKAYWEPFCGSAAVLLAKPPSSQETISDLHGDATNLAWILADAKLASDLYDRVVRTLFAEAIFEQARQILQSSPCPDAIDTDRAYWYFIFSWMGRNGLAGTSSALTSSLAIRYTTGGGSPSIRFRSAVESIPAWHHRLCNVLILRRNAFDLLPEIEDSPDVAIYIDSPYLMETRSKGAAYDQGARYVHDFDGVFGSDSFFGSEKDEDSHDRLAAALLRFQQARIVISHYYHPRLRTLYPSFQIRHLDATKKIAQQNRRGITNAIDAAEVLLMNGPSYAEAA